MGTEANHHRLLQKPQQPARWLVRTQQIFAGIEVALWVVFLFAWMFQVARKPLAQEFVILSLSLIFFLYVLVPFFVFGSLGWKRHIGSFFVGQAMALAVMSLVFLVEGWPFAEEIRIISFMPCLFGAIGTSVFLWLNLRKHPGDLFYIFLLARLLIGVLVTAGPTVRLFL